MFAICKTFGETMCCMYCWIVPYIKWVIVLLFVWCVEIVGFISCSIFCLSYTWQEVCHWSACCFLNVIVKDAVLVGVTVLLFPDGVTYILIVFAAVILYLDVVTSIVVRVFEIGCYMPDGVTYILIVCAAVLLYLGVVTSTAVKYFGVGC